jgi:hypothetical protein
MPDEPSENHDGDTQPLPNLDPGASTEPLRADEFADGPVAYAPAVGVARRPLPRWVSPLVLGLVIVAGVLLAAMLLPMLLPLSDAPTPVPTSTLPSPTPTEETEQPPSEEPPPPPETEPTVSVPEPSVEPTVPEPTPTG